MREKIETETYFTPKQAAEYFNLSLSTIKNYIYAGKLKTLTTPGGHHRIRKTELLAVLEGRAKIVPVSEDKDIALEKVLCPALLNVYKTLGASGNAFIMHARNVSKIASDISKALSLNSNKSEYIEMAALVHDIGNIGMDRRIILKAGPLTRQEYEIIKKHPGIGEELLNSINSMKELVSMVGEHHERIDGNGYPKGLMGGSISKGARIISIAEAFDSMVSEYSYKDPVSKEMAISELMQNRGSQFDGDIVEVFVKIA